MGWLARWWAWSRRIVFKGVTKKWVDTMTGQHNILLIAHFLQRQEQKGRMATLGKMIVRALILAIACPAGLCTMLTCYNTASSCLVNCRYRNWHVTGTQIAFLQHKWRSLHLRTHALITGAPPTSTQFVNGSLLSMCLTGHLPNWELLI